MGGALSAAHRAAPVSHGREAEGDREEADMKTDSTTHDTPTIGGRRRQRVALLLAVPLLIAVLAACQSNTGLSDEDAAAIKDQLQQVASRLDAVEERLVDLSQMSSDAPAQLISEVRAATSDVGAAQTILADVTNQLEVSVPADTVDQTGDLDETVPGAHDTLQDLGNDIEDGVDNAREAIDNGLDNAGDAIDDARDTINEGLNDARDTINDGVDNARDDLDPLLEPSDPTPGIDVVPEQEPAPLGN